ncbi:hypothetical protein FQN54_003158 [Arachnomyces sp. PD_36]|nr:hypothetical protein FQN54_003158 [Arachnomyces sp. PD_36]
MKPLSTLLALSAGVLAAATQNTAQIYTFDTETSPSSSSQEIETLSASTARLILSRRLGSSQFSQLGDVDESVLGQIDKFGGVQEGIFGQDGDVSKLLVVVEGVKEGDVTAEAASGGFVVKDGSEDLVQEGLVASLLGRKVGKAHGLECAYEFEDGEVVFDVLDTEKCVEKDAILENNGDKASLSNLKVSSWTGRSTTAVIKIKSQSTSTLETLISELSSLAKSTNQESTLILLPSTSTTNKLTRRSAQYDYDYASSPAPAPTGSIPSTLLPICHTSESSCQSATNNCSGHGTCYRKYGSQDNGDDDSGDCYACRCERTIVRKNDDGTVKTVQWGGSACQKKDVSIPFWLLAGFTVLLVAVVSWAIGLMYSVGGEELPSVIGAGVSGAKPGQK